MFVKAPSGNDKKDKLQTQTTTVIWCRALLRRSGPERFSFPSSTSSAITPVVMTRNLYVLCFSVLTLGSVTCTGEISTFKDTQRIIHQLYNLTSDLQVKKSTKLIPLIQSEKERGVYESNVRLNFHGRPEISFVRDDFSVFDNNMFVTSWVTSCLLEAFKYGDAPKPTTNQLVMALDAISKYHDKNLPYQHSIMIFWTQILNRTSSVWESTPKNLVELIKLTNYLPVKTLEEILKLLGFADLEEFIEELMDERSDFLNAFRIPSDFDDTFVNLGLGALLTEMSDDFPSAHATWSRDNTNLSSIFSTMKKYAYRPFSSDERINTVDPRSYFYLRQFLEDSKINGRDVALVPTWVQDLDEVRVLYSKGVAMPFNINNVDVTVASNAIFGITAAVLSGLEDPSLLDDVDLRQIYLNTTAMVVYQINKDFSGRRDLALTYYPSLFECYWFVARTFSLLQRKSQSGRLPNKALETVEKMLQPVLTGRMTQVILSKAQPLSEDMVYFDDFLGDGDVTTDNKTVVRGEDRIFTTAMAVNALINTWSVFREKDRKLVWNKDTPKSVQDTVTKAAKWLVTYTLIGKYKPWNVFFSGSTKGDDSLPFWYPVNRLEYLNGTRIPSEKHFPQNPFILGFQNVVPEMTYLGMLNQSHFGRKTPTTFPGFNAGSSFFPFWSSEAYTYSTTMLALAQFNNLSTK